MDFFEAQDSARRASRRLVILFGLAVIALIVSIYVVVLLIFGYGEATSDAPSAIALWNPALFAAVTAGTLLVIGSGSGWKTMQLSRGGGSVVAEYLGGRVISPTTTDPDERRLLNVVEEMALASGITVPTVYLLERESGINAFAAGFKQDDAVIGVTRGCMELLSRDELQGVIGHEFSHVLNGDMRLNLRMIGVLHGILVISMIGYFILRSGGGRSSGNKKGGGGGFLLLGLALYILGWIGVLFGKIIRAAVSRQREFLADGAAVQFTRNPPGLAGALKKIGGLSGGSKVESPKAHEASHLFFANALSAGFAGLLSTHPPLTQRVRRLDPGFDGTFPPVKMRPRDGEGEERVAAESSRERLQEVLRPVILGTAAAAMEGRKGSITDHAGELSQAHLDHVAQLMQNTPAALREATREPAAAQALMLVLLLDPETEARDAQMLAVSGTLDPAVADELQKLEPLSRELGREARLPLLDLAFPALRQMSDAQFAALRQAVKTVVESDQKITLFEYTLQRALMRHLAPHFGQVEQPSVNYYALGQLARECSVVLSSLAHFGTSDAEVAKRAFSAGAAALESARAGVKAADLTFLPRAESRLGEFDAALSKLVRISPALKRSLLKACEATVALDHEITPEEGEMIRAIADALDVPVPPLLGGQRAPAPPAPATPPPPRKLPIVR